MVITAHRMMSNKFGVTFHDSEVFVSTAFINSFVTMPSSRFLLNITGTLSNHFLFNNILCNSCYIFFSWSCQIFPYALCFLFLSWMSFQPTSCKSLHFFQDPLQMLLLFPSRQINFSLLCKSMPLSTSTSMFYIFNHSVYLDGL